MEKERQELQQERQRFRDKEKEIDDIKKIYKGQLQALEYEKQELAALRANIE